MSKPADEGRKLRPNDKIKNDDYKQNIAMQFEKRLVVSQSSYALDNQTNYN